jgi:hypothetical protein
VFKDAKKRLKDEAAVAKKSFFDKERSEEKRAERAKAKLENEEREKSSKEAKQPKRARARAGGGLIRAATTPAYMTKYEALDIAQRTNELLYEQNGILEQQLTELARMNELLSKLTDRNASPS